MSNWIERHSVNCYFCGELVDERNCINADDFNGNDGGSICPDCLKKKKQQNHWSIFVVHKVCGFQNGLANYATFSSKEEMIEALGQAGYSYVEIPISDFVTV